jgi:hypothetical protein
MKKSLSIYLIFTIIILTSCQNNSIVDDAIKTLDVDENEHCFVDENGKSYVENTLVSQGDRHVYGLKMDKGLYYRISASQSDASINQTSLCLVNAKGDTLAQSLNEDISKSSIVLESPETTTYYIIVELIRRTNPVFTYRLHFEEISDNVITFAGANWECNGSWSVTDSNNAELKNCDSRILRHLRLQTSPTGHPNMSFVIQTTSSVTPDFGFILQASNEYTQGVEYSYELTTSGYAFVAFKKDLNYTIITLNPGSMSFNWGLLNDINLDFSKGIKVSLVYQETQYWVYLNDVQLNPINGSLQNLNLLIEDCGDGSTVIKDFQLEE